MSQGKIRSLGRVGTALLTVVLWAVTSVVGLVEIVIVRAMVVRVFARFFADERAYGTDYWGSVALGQVLVVILAIVWIGLVIGAGEYYYKYLGQPKSWRLLARVIAVEISVLVLAVFI
jgi:heme/copper-type cytochrome/quinol oxidase subunit 2